MTHEEQQQQTAFLFALNNIRSLERERQRLFKMIGRLNETIERLENKEPPAMEFKVGTPEGVRTVIVKGTPRYEKRLDIVEEGEE